METNYPPLCSGKFSKILELQIEMGDHLSFKLNPVHNLTYNPVAGTISKIQNLLFLMENQVDNNTKSKSSLCPMSNFRYK